MIQGDDMKEVRVSQASRDVARSTKSFGLSLGELELEREKLVAEKKRIELSIMEHNDFISKEQMRIRSKHRNDDPQESVAEWILCRSKLNYIRIGLVKEKNEIEKRLKNIKLEIRQLSGTTIKVKDIGIGNGFLDRAQMEQYTEGLRSVIHSELGLLIEIIPFLRNLVRFRRKYLKARRKLESLKKEKEFITVDPVDPLELLSTLLKILNGLKDRLGSENFTDIEKEIISYIEGYLLIFEQIDTIEEKAIP